MPTRRRSASAASQPSVPPGADARPGDLEGADDAPDAAAAVPHDDPADGGPAGAAGASKASAAGPRLLKKYPNRRLYDTTTSAYITLADVKAMVLAHEPFQVRDAKSGEDLTRAILLQIILEEEAGGVPMFSESMLANLIRFYGHAMQGMMGAYMERNLQQFVEMQQRFAAQAQQLAGTKSLTTEMWKQFLAGQTPVVNAWMGSYLEQSQGVLQQMQEQMARQAGAMFPGVPAFKTPRR